MVFESIVVDILNKFLGSYVQNLDSSQLKLGIWGGDVTLKNLIFKENALDDLNLPVKAAYGQLEKLTLNIPWKNIYTAPVKVAIDGLNLLVVPKSVVTYDPEKEEKLLWDTKQQQLKRLEEAKRIEEESKKPRDPQQDSFTEKLVAQIIKNLQIRITNIHVRYEDKRSNPGSPFAFGITLHNLFFESADENWKTGIFQDSSKIIFKVVTLNSFAVYWNSKSKLFLSMQDNEKITAFKNGIATKDSVPPTTNYILGPINSTLKLQLNPKPEQDGSNYSIPKIMVIFIMEDLGIGISKRQYQDILILTQSLEWMEISARYQKYRPNVPYKGHAKEWWKFAHKCVLYEDVKRISENWSWNHIKEHRKRCRLYKELYRQKLYGKKLPSEAQYQELERDLDIFNIALIRKQADMEFEKSGGKKEEKKSTGWFGGWFGGKESKKEDTSFVKQFEEAMTAEEKAKLFDAIGYQDNVVAAVYPKEFIENKFIFELKNLHVVILNDFSKPALEVVKLSLMNVVSSVEQRPSAQAVKIMAKVEALTVTGIKRQNVSPTLITTHNTEKDKKYYLLDVLFETNPLDGKCDQRLHITSRPLQIVYNADTINEMATVFKPPQSVEIYSKLQSAATETLAGIKEVSTASFQYAIEHHKYLDLNLDLKAPFVIVPESGVMKNDVPLLILDMGSLKMQSVKREQNAAYIPNLHKLGLSQDEIAKEMISQAYDKYTIKLVGIQVLLANPNDDWMEARNKPTSKLHIWQPTNMKITLEKSVILDDPRIPKVKIWGGLPSVHFSLSDVKLLQLAKLAFSIPIPQEEPEDFIPAANLKPNKLESQIAVHDVKKVTVPTAKPQSAPLPEVQLTNLEFSFELGEVQLTITEVKDKHENEFLTFSVSRLGISMVNKTFSTAVDVYLGDVDCHNMMFKTSDGKPIHLIETGLKEKAAAKLLSIHYLNADRKGPTFSTVYNNTLQLIEVNFATLKVILHQEALLSIMKFSNTLVAEIDRIKKASQPESVQAVVTMTKRASMTSLNSAFGDFKQQMTAGHGKKRRRKVPVEVIDLKLVAKLGQLSVEICNITKSIVAINISGLDASVIMQKEKMTVANVLRKIEVLDPTPKAIYPQIISFVGNDVFDTTIEIYNSATEGAGYLDMSKVDTSVTASIGCIRIIFLNKFVTDCLTFLNNFQAATARIKEATVKAAEVAMENVSSVYQKASRIRLNINMKAPVILMPRNSTAMEVMLLDMGRIKVFNKFTVGVSTAFSSPTPPILEHMQVELQKFKITRALINPSTHTEIADCPLLEPTSFLIRLNRNLSANWCKDIPEMDISGNFKAISLTMSQEDYGMFMRILNENLSETSPEMKQLQSAPTSAEQIKVQAVQHVESQRLATVGEAEVEEEEDNREQETVFTRYKFNFILDSISASLYFGKSELKKGTVVRQPSAALTYFEVHVIAAKGEMLTDGSLWTNVVIVNCFMDDVRSTTDTYFPRMMDKKSQNDKDSMIDVTFKKDAHNDTFVDVKVRSFNLVACPNYLMTIMLFFTKDITDVAPPPPQTSAVPETQQRQITTSPVQSAKVDSTEKEEPSKGTFTLVLSVEQPDIILVEDETNINTEAIILNTTVAFKLRSTPDVTTMSGTISDLQLVSCCYNPKFRESSKTEILSPCDISLSSSTPTGEGMHTDIDISDMEIHMAPSTVRLLTSVASKFSAVEDKGEQEEEGEKDFSDLWAVQKISDFKFWFLKPDEAVEAVETEPVEPVEDKPRKEQLILKARTILLTMEIGEGNQAVPMLLLEAGLFADVQNWSSALEVAGGLTLEMLSYNEKLALWEPFIERIDSPKGNSRPWELTLELKSSSAPSQNVDLFEQDLEEVAYEQPKLSLVIMANDVMDLCITKTSLEVLTNLGQAFSDAVHMMPCAEKEIKSPFLIRNDTGIPITLLLKAQDFLDEGWEWMLILIPDPKDQSLAIPEEQSQNISEVILEHDTSVPLMVKTNPTKVSVSKKSVLKLQDMTSEKKLLIKIVEMNASRHISVKRADKRFFQLPRKTYPGDQWGIVSDVTAMYGRKIITLRSVLQIKNHLKVPMEVYYMAPESEELKCCGVVEHGQKFNCPLPAVYTTTSEIFFRPVTGDYTFSSTSYVWKDLIKNPILYKHVECASRVPGEKPFLLTVIGEIDQIFFEDSRKKTLASTCYILNLKPTAVLTNLLPVTISCSDENGLNEETIEGGDNIELLWAEINVSLIIVKLKNYLGKTWVCTKKLSSTTGELSVWSFETQDSPKLTMDLGMYMENDHDSLSLSLYCPFWMINKTGALLSYRADDMHNVIVHPPDVEGPILFSFRAKNFFARKKASLMIKDSEWSDKFSIDVVGSSGTVKCPSKDGISYEVGVQIRLAKVKLTKIIIFMPYYLIVNNCKFDVEYIENDLGNWITLPYGECVPFWPQQSKIHELKIKAKEYPEESKPFCFTDPATVLLRMNNKIGGIQVDCQINEASSIITFSEYRDGSATVRLVNCLETFTVNYHQSGEKDEHMLKPQETVLYTWDNPSGKNELVWSIKGTKEIRNDLIKDGIGEMALEGENPTYWVLFLDNTQRTLLFTDDIVIATRSQVAGEFERADQDVTISLKGFGLSLVDNINKFEVIYLSITSTGIIWEASKEKSRRYKPLTAAAGQIIEDAYQKYLDEVRLGKTPPTKVVLEHKIEVDFQTYMMTKPNKRKIRRSFQTGMWLNYKSSPHRVQLHAKINRLQIDNQMPDCVFPVILAPVPPPKTVAADSEPKPFAEVSIMMRKSEYSTLRQYKYFKILIQEFHIKADQAFLNGIMAMFAAEVAEEETNTMFQTDIESTNIDLKDVAEIQSSQDPQNFYNLLHFSPLKVHISFSMQGFGSSDSSKSIPLSSNFVNLFIQSVGVTLTEIQDVVFKLAYFERQNKFISQRQLTKEVITHYSGQAIKQMYVLVLGLDVIGNPFGLVIGLTRGVEDLFYEPIQGAIQGPEEFAEGLALGVKSLFGHAVGGAAGAVSRITGTLGKGVAALTLDEDYQKRRREAQLHRSGNFQENMAQSGKGLVMGVFDGVTGVFVKPIEGAKQEGVEGFFKGMGKGVVGLVTRPTAGVIDFASGTFDSVKRIAENTSEIHRCRAPRYFQPDGVVRPYNQHEAEGYKLLQDVEKGKFASTDHYIAHAPLPPEGRHVVLVTDKRVILVTKGDIFGQWNADWQVTWDEMKTSPTASEKGVVITLKEARKKKLGLFGSGDNTRTIHCKTAELSKWIVEKINEAKERQE